MIIIFTSIQAIRQEGGMGYDIHVRCITIIFDNTTHCINISKKYVRVCYYFIEEGDGDVFSDRSLWEGYGYVYC